MLTTVLMGLNALAGGPTVAFGAGLDDAPVRGVVRALHQAMISTDLAVRVAAIHAREGEAFAAGDVLVEFDCRRQHAVVAAAEAQQLEMRLSVDKNRMLLKTQAVGRNDLEVSEARLTKAAAETDALKSQLEQCRLVAPFAGRVTDVALQVHETSQPGRPYFGIVATDRLEIDLIAPSTWAGRLRPGYTFQFAVDELQRSVTASVIRTGAVVDPVSQTIKIIATVVAPASDLLPGMSGSARLTPGPAR